MDFETPASSIPSEINSLLDRFDAEWRSGNSPSLREYLNFANPSNRIQLLEQLLRIEIEYRFQAGESVSPESYREIGDDAVQWAGKVIEKEKSASATEPVSLQEFAPDSFDLSGGETVPPKSGRSPSNATPKNLQSPAGSTPNSIGPYKLVNKIGEGGMGSVWLAEQQEPVYRQVAVKLIQAGSVAKYELQQFIARFEAERQALAMMNHTNIAKVLDAGTTETGEPYFVMEYIRGTSLTKHCDRKKLGLKERLSIFSDVCRAVHHAHQKGIIHRDLKPDNIVVTEVDDQPVPKVIDFGLAKTLHSHSKLTDKSIHSVAGAPVGTWQYMSPEQAGVDGIDIDTRTDIYSLGAILYELLTGSPPIEKKTLENKLWLQRAEIIREKEPPRPSDRLSNSRLRKQAISEVRSVVPAKLHSALKGELDWIVLRAIEKDRSRRYDSAMELSKDVRRYINGAPVEARPPSVTYRLGKFVRKNRRLVASLSAIGSVLLVSGILFLTQQRRIVLSEIDKAQFASEQLETADASELGSILADLSINDTAIRKATRDKFHQQLSDPSATPRSQRRLALAMLSWDGENEASIDKPTVLELVKGAEPAELIQFCQVLNPKMDGLTNDLWDWASSRNESESACAISLLAHLEPESENWSSLDLPDISRFLVKQPIAELSNWARLLKPKRELVNPLVERQYHTTRTINDDRSRFAAAFLAVMNSDNPQYIVGELFAIADAKQLEQLIKSLSNEPEKNLALVTSRYEESASANESANLIVATIGLQGLTQKLATSSAVLDNQINQGWQSNLCRQNDKGEYDYSVQTEVIERLAHSATPPSVLKSILMRLEDAKTHSDVEALATILLALGQYNESQLSSPDRDEMRQTVLKIFKNHDEARIHASARWLLNSWGGQAVTHAAELELRREWPEKGKNWHVDLLGNTFVIFETGSDFNKYYGAKASRVARHRFGICMTEVTIGQFKGLEETYNDIVDSLRRELLDSHEEDENGLPMVKAQYRQMAKFCQYLTDEHNKAANVKIPLQRVFFTNSTFENELGEHVKEKEYPGFEDFQFDLRESGFEEERTGYRLPTDGEWKFANKANTSTTRSFGNSDTRLEHYAWYSTNSNNTLHTVARKKPEVSGLFDMYGNVSEICLNQNLEPDEKKDKYTLTGLWQLLGGYYNSKPEEVMANPERELRKAVTPVRSGASFGFRLARTYPSDK